MNRATLVLQISALFFVSSTAQAVQPPVVPPVVPTSHSVNYEAEPGAFITVLQQRRLPAAQWTTHLGTSSGGVLTVNFSGLQPGQYEYRVEAQFLVFSGVDVSTTYSYSATTSVDVVTGAIPAIDAVSNQLLYSYELSRGAYDSDGVANDFFLDRTSGGASGNGTVEDVVLRFLGNGEFEAIVVSAGTALASQVSGWPQINAEINLLDLNLDGFVDVAIDNLADYIPGVPRQVIVSSGQVFQFAPATIVSYQGEVDSFLYEFGEYMENTNYYEDTAPTSTVTQLEYRFFCYDENGQIYLSDFGDPNPTCQFGLVWVTYTVLDLSGFNQDALQMRLLFPPDSSGVIDAVMTPGTPVASDVAAIFQRVFGVELFGGVLQSGCSGVFAYDDEFDLPCTDGDFIGDTVFRVLIGEVVGEEATGTTPVKKYRYLTASEISLLTINGMSDIEDLDQVRIYNKGYGGWGAGLFGSGGEVMAPNGHVYVGPNNSVLLWSEDYSLENRARQALFLHEMVHVYQTRNEGCGSICMGFKKAFAGSYIYHPLAPGKPFSDYGIEQEAEIINDRWRKCGGLPLAFNGDNNGTTLSELVAITTPVPFPITPNICVN